MRPPTTQGQRRKPFNVSPNLKFIDNLPQQFAFSRQWLNQLVFFSEVEGTSDVLWFFLAPRKYSLRKPLTTQSGAERWLKMEDKRKEKQYPIECLSYLL